MFTPSYDCVLVFDSEFIGVTMKCCNFNESQRAFVEQEGIRDWFVLFKHYQMGDNDFSGCADSLLSPPPSHLHLQVLHKQANVLSPQKSLGDQTLMKSILVTCHRVSLSFNGFLDELQKGRNCFCLLLIYLSYTWSSCSVIVKGNLSPWWFGEFCWPIAAPSCNLTKALHWGLCSFCGACSLWMSMQPFKWKNKIKIQFG